MNTSIIKKSVMVAAMAAVLTVSAATVCHAEAKVCNTQSQVTAYLNQQVEQRAGTIQFQYPGKVRTDFYKWSPLNGELKEGGGNNRSKAVYLDSISATQGYKMNGRTYHQYTVFPVYNISKTKQRRLNRAVRKAVKYVNHGSAKMKVRRCDKYLRKHCRYDFKAFDAWGMGASGDAYNEYGALVKHKAVCSGYASATNLILRKCHVKTEWISGTGYYDYPAGGPHSWTISKCGGKWYGTDTTWSDMYHAKKYVLQSFRKGSQFSKSHRPDDCFKTSSFKRSHPSA